MSFLLHTFLDRMYNYYTTPTHNVMNNDLKQDNGPSKSPRVWIIACRAAHDFHSSDAHLFLDTPASVLRTSSVEQLRSRNEHAQIEFAVVSYVELPGSFRHPSWTVTLRLRPWQAPRTRMDRHHGVIKHVSTSRVLGELADAFNLDLHRHPHLLFIINLVHEFRDSSGHLCFERGELVS